MHNCKMSFLIIMNTHISYYEKSFLGSMNNVVYDFKRNINISIANTLIRLFYFAFLCMDACRKYSKLLLTFFFLNIYTFSHDTLSIICCLNSLNNKQKTKNLIPA